MKFIDTMQNNTSDDILLWANDNLNRLENELPDQDDAMDDTESFSMETPACIADRYRFISPLGRGAQGKVYLARRLSDNKKVAIKVLMVDSVKNWKEYELFTREANVLKTLNIDGVAKFYEAPEYLDLDEPCVFIVQEYIDALSLEEMMKPGFRMSLGRIFKLAVQLIDILESLHTHVPPIIHRDIKPANILMKVCEGGGFKPYLIDFGAVSNPQVQSGGSTVAGTYGYMPPEQLMGKPVPASDIYALGALLSYLLTGVEPGEMQMTDFHLIIDPYMENIPNAVIATLHAMLDPKYENRLSDYGSLRTRFTEFSKNQFGMVDHAGADSNYSLTDVKALGQRGNIDLWMELPDAVPRELPSCVLDLKRNGQFEEMPLSKKLFKAQIKNQATCFNIVMMFFISIMFIVPFIIIGVIYIIDNEFMYGIIFWTMALLVFGLGFYFIFIQKAITFRNKYHNKDFEKEDEYEMWVRRILCNGTKCIASVVDFTYLGTCLDTLESYTQYEENRESQYTSDEIVNNYNIGIYNHDAPRFRLRYKFNPPDDDNPDDLVHEIICHEDYSKTLKRGTPLPILYLLIGDKPSVLSMPYPFPLGSVVRFKDFYGRS